jgi:hypothetical protein
MNSEDDLNRPLDMKHDQLHIVYGGTKIIQHDNAVVSPTSSQPSRGLGVPLPPDGGCPAFVLRTGYNTTQV